MVDTSARQAVDPGPVHRRPTLAALIVGRRAKHLVVAVWLGLLVLSVTFAGKLGDVQATGAESALPAGAESTQVTTLRKASNPTEALPIVVVYERPSGLTDADRAKAAADTATFARHPDLKGPVDGPVIAPDGQAAQIVVPLGLGTDAFARATDVVESINAVAQRDANGMNVHVTGPAAAIADQARAIAGIDTTLLLATAAVVILTLLITYRSPTLWLLPIAAAGVALTAAQALIYLLARHADLTVTADGSAILTILVFGAGTDYALLLIARYRQELRRHPDRHEAMAVALHRRPRLIWVSTTLVLAALSAGVLQLDPTGLTAAESFRGHHGSTAGTEALARHFPAGAGRPVVVVSQPQRAASVRAAFAATPGVDAGSVTEPAISGEHAYLEGILTDPGGQQGRLRHRRPAPGSRPRDPGGAGEGRRGHRDQARRAADGTA